MSYKLTILTPMLETHDIQGTVNFYTDVLGFSTENYLPKIGWAALKYDDVNIMFTMPNPLHNLGQAMLSGSLYFNTDNIDALWESIKDRCTIKYPIENFNYGMREFAILDNNGYMLQFGQEIEV